MRYSLSSLSLSVLALVAALALFTGCTPKSAAVIEQKAPAQLFPPADACSYTSLAPGKVFSRLGGGEWAPVNPQDPSTFECAGSNPSVRIFDGSDSSAEATYRATGTKDGASMIELNYNAYGKVPNESTLRNTFGNLVSLTTQKSLNAPLPDLFRRKIANLASYSEPGKGSAENFDVGGGFISLTREASSGGESVSVSVRLYPDVVLKLEN